MRIAYVASPKIFSKGASAIEVLRMAEAIARAGLDVELIVPCNFTPDGIYDYYGVEPIFRLKLLPQAPGLSLRHLVHAIASALYTARKKSNYDLVFSRNLLFAMLSARVLGLPTIYDAHHPPDSPASRSALMLVKDSELLIKLVAISEGIGRVFLGLGLPGEKLTLAPNGVDVSRFSSLGKKEEARAGLGLPREGTIVSHIGNIYSGRGIELLLDASRMFPKVLFLIVGGEERDVARCKRLAERLGVSNVVFTGFIPPGKVVSYYAASDYLVLPYTTRMTTKWGRVEADFASLLKLAEYMASGKPIIATDIPAVRYALRDGFNSILVAPDSAEAIAKGIGRALCDPALSARIGEQARLDAARFSLKQRVEKIFGNPTAQSKTS
jgi:glycosyltransferase involved in cell wall biosynthesis